MAKKLTDILKSFPTKKTFSLADNDGYHPHSREGAAKAFLRQQLQVQDAGEPYENDFLGGVKQYNRGAHRHGHDNVDWNNTDNKGGLKTSNIATEEVDDEDLEMLGEVFDAYFEENPDASYHQAYSDIIEALDEAKSWNPPEVQAKAAKFKKEQKMFDSAKREINRLKKKGK